MLTITGKTKYKQAIMNLDYSGLDKDEIKECNTFLLNNGVSFVDCIDAFECDQEKTFYTFKR